MDLTIDELAIRTGTKSSTIRMYQHQRLLPGPELRGRVGYYGDGHVARLELIARLKQKGYSLAAIRDLALTWETGRDIDALIGLETAAGPSGTAEPVELGPEEFTARFRGADVDAETVQRAVALGLVELRGDRIRVNDRRFLDIGAELAGLGISPRTLLEEWGHVDEVTHELAARFREVFEATVWKPFVDQGMPDREVEHVTATLGRMRELGAEIVEVAMAGAIDAAARAAMEEEAGRRLVEDGPAGGPGC